ncbi:ABC transporter ATP-binding protein [Ferrovibrio sp.]|uniref:ABC transporter ATP-binding protein n=1 Tax=Ferrovibrio sp. TaxID=1917215 RepID=UPI00311F2C84
MARDEDREAVIRVRGLVNRFDDHAVHENLDLDVWRGEVLGVVGGSGTGKSVLLRTIIALNAAAAGSIELLGTDMINGDAAALRNVRRRFGVLFQDGALFSSLTVAQNIEVPLKEYYDLPAVLLDEIVATKVHMVGLPPDAANKYPAELSGGMRKRAGLARALALDPEVVFFDEPTAGLDPIGAAAFDRLVRDLQKALGLTVFMVTHDLDSLYAICDRIAVLAEKKVLLEGPMPAMLESTHPWVNEYFHGPRARAAAASAAAERR